MKKKHVLIIGAGVIGTCVARELSRFEEISIDVVEKEADVGWGTTKANSGIVHGGYTSTPGTLRAKFEVLGNEAMERWCTELDVPFKRIGAYVLAWKEKDVEILHQLKQQGKKNNVKGLKIISGEEARSVEPILNKNIIAALDAPMVGIVSPYLLAISAFENAKRNGVDFHFNTKVISVELLNDRINVITTGGIFPADLVINCAGIHSGKIANLFGDTHIKIKIYKGEYFLGDKELCKGITKVNFPIPTPVSKGILVAPTTEGTVILGPTSENIDTPSTATTYEGLEKIKESIKKIYPDIDLSFVITEFTGLRAKDVSGDFIIGWSSKDNRVFHLAGIQSPGLTGAPAIAEYVGSVFENRFSFHIKKQFDPIRKAPKRLFEITPEEAEQLWKKDPAYGRVVCRCEMVSEAEIREAIRRGATTLDGIKFRTRAGMGRCQGGFCTPWIMKILAEELKKPITEITKKSIDSEIVVGNTKEKAYYEEDK